MTRIVYGFALGVSLFLSGCVSYSLHESAPVEGWPPLAGSSKTKPVVTVRFSPTPGFNDQQRARLGATEQFHGIILNTFAQSGRFERVTTQAQGSDLYVNAILGSYETGSKLSAVITGATLLLVPMTFRTSYTLEMIYRNGDGKVIGRTEQTESIQTWVQLFLVVAAPFNTVPDKVVQRLTQRSVEEAIRLKLI